MLYEKIIAGAILILAILMFVGNFKKKSKGSCPSCSNKNGKENTTLKNNSGISIITKKEK